MATIAQAPAIQRPPTITAATVVLGLMGAAGVLAAPFSPEEGGAVFIAISLVIGGLRLIAAAGVWRLRRWAAILGFAVSLIDTLLAAPGLLFAPDAVWRVLSLIGVVSGIATMVLLVLPASRRAYA